MPPDGTQHRDGAGQRHLALPLLRGQSPAGLRPRRRVRHAAVRPGRLIRPVRPRREPRGRSGARSAATGSRSASPDWWTDRWTRPARRTRRCAGPPPAATWERKREQSDDRDRSPRVRGRARPACRRPGPARRLGLVVRVESDSQRPGDEFLAGFGKTARDGLHLKAAAVRETCDVVISNVLVIDAVAGHSQGIHRHPRGPDPRHRAGRQPRHPRRRRCRRRHRDVDRVRRGADRHRGRRRHPCPSALAAYHGGLAGLGRDHDHRPGVRAGVGRRRQLAVGTAPRLQRLRRLAGQYRLPGPGFVLG